MKYLKLDEVKAVLREIKVEKGERVMLAYLIGFWHGLRASEITGIKGRDLRHGYVDCKRLKGSLPTSQRWQKHSDPELNEYAMLERLEIADDELLLPIGRDWVRKVFKAAALRAGINPRFAHTHTLKHSIAMLVIGSGIENAKQRLGHKSLSSTGYYLRVSDDTASDAINSHLGIEA